MIVHVLRLTRWEWFKLRKRWMPWLLLAVAIVVVQATLWGFYAAYGNVGSEYDDGYGVPDARGEGSHESGSHALISWTGPPPPRRRMVICESSRESGPQDARTAARALKLSRHR